MLFIQPSRQTKDPVRVQIFCLRTVQKRRSQLPRGLRPLACWDCGFESHRGMDVCLLWVWCVVRKRSLRRIDHSSRGVLPTVVRRCVWSRNLENEEAKVRYGAVKIQSQWVVTARKQQQQYRNIRGHSLTCALLSPLYFPVVYYSILLNILCRISGLTGSYLRGLEL